MYNKKKNKTRNIYFFMSFCARCTTKRDLIMAPSGSLFCKDCAYFEENEPFEWEDTKWRFIGAPKSMGRDPCCGTWYPLFYMWRGQVMGHCPICHGDRFKIHKTRKRKDGSQLVCIRKNQIPVKNANKLN